MVLPNITYFSVRTPSTLGLGCRLITTYSKEWQLHYFENNYDCVDPVVSTAIKVLLPTDWDMVPKDDATSKTFFGEAADFRISPQGLTIPVRAIMGKIILVSFHSNAPRSEWNAFKKREVWQEIQTHHASTRSGQNHATGRTVHSRHSATFQRRRGDNRPDKEDNPTHQIILPFLSHFVRIGLI